jgi:hypothetical protein
MVLYNFVKRIMPIPPLQKDGLLPPGLYLADTNEIEEHFGKSTPRRHELFERLILFVELARHCGALRMFVNGSFVTANPEPGDEDVVIWLGTKYFDLLEQADREASLLEEMFDSREPKEAFFVNAEWKWEGWIEFFSRVRGNLSKRKGLVEVKLT